ncbi:MAG TPA: nicotinate-nucleotide adenylyltransferase [Lysobacter sp.]|nr:nicotinate-nucleotide adenylyltransferase [Lysobacter sp.]
MDLTVFYGGTFDPVHNGHLAVARSARDVLGVTIHLMPAADPPHRAAPGASALQRARMLDLAVAGEPGMVVDRREVSRGARSYSVDTLREVREQLGAQVPVALLLGADSLLGLASWKEWQTLFTLAHFVVAERIGNNIEARLPPELQAFTQGRWVATSDELRATPSGRLLRLRQPLHPESASEIRARIATGQPWRHLVPPAVAAYIDRHQLYAGRPASSAPL